MSDEANVLDDTIKATMTAIRLAVAELDGLDPEVPRKTLDLLAELAEKHGDEAIKVVAVFLARAAAAGFRQVAGDAGDPTERVISSYETHVEFGVLFNRLFPGQGEC